MRTRLDSFIRPRSTRISAKLRPRRSHSIQQRSRSLSQLPLTERQRALHALNRLTFGPRPGDVEAVLTKGLDSWIEDQLHPESIDDSAINSRLGPYATTRLNSKQLAAGLPF